MKIVWSEEESKIIEKVNFKKEEVSSEQVFNVITFLTQYQDKHEHELSTNKLIAICTSSRNWTVLTHELDFYEIHLDDDKESIERHLTKTAWKQMDSLEKKEAEKEEPKKEKEKKEAKKDEPKKEEKKKKEETKKEEKKGKK